MFPESLSELCFEIHLNWHWVAHELRKNFGNWPMLVGPWVMKGSQPSGGPSTMKVMAEHWLEPWENYHWSLWTLSTPSYSCWVLLFPQELDRGGVITQFCNLWIQQGQIVEKLGFYIANLGWDWIILGYPWFQKFNLHFNWTAHALEGDNVVIKMAGYHKQHRPTIWITQPIISEPTDQVEVVKLIPEWYHHHWKVFSEQASHWFPPAQEEDHAIVLKPGAAATINCCVYWQTETELEGTH